MNEPVDRERRQSQCPACRVHRGTPITVTVGDGHKTISYRCEACGHEWRIVRPENGTPFLGSTERRT